MGWFNKKEKRAQESGYHDADLYALFGLRDVTKEMAFQVPTIAGGIDLISNVVASTPIKLYVDSDGKAKEVTDDIRTSLLNDETGDTLNANEFWRAIIRDYYTGKGGYAYINKEKGKIKSLHYVDESYISINKNVDPIFKDFDVLVNGITYKPYEFLKILRNTKNGAEGIPITKENSKLIAVAFTSLIFELNMAKRGGNKKGFLKSEKKLDDPSLAALKSAFSRLYSSDAEGTDNFVLLNNGIDFKESSNTSVELQLNENKLTNSEEFAKILHLSTEVISGKNNDTNGLAKLAAIPLMMAIQCALNKDLLLEKEKGRYYFAFDTKELLKGDMQQRFNAYKTALDGNFMQVDEVRYVEDLPPLDLNWIKLGLQDVLYNPLTKEVYTPNTGKTSNMENLQLQNSTGNDTLESRAQPRDKEGKFASSGGGGRSKKGKAKYAPSQRRNSKGITVSPKKYSKLCGTFNTNFPSLTPKDGARTIFDGKNRYKATSDGYGGIIITRKAKVD